MLVNRYPVVYNLVEEDFSLTANIVPIAMRKGGNELLVQLMSKQTSRHIINLLDFPRIGEETYVVEMEPPAEDGSQRGRFKVGQGEGKEVFPFVIPSEKRAVITLGEEDKPLFTERLSEEPDLSVSLVIPFESEIGLEEELPWSEVAPIEEVNVASLAEKASAYATAMNSGDIGRVEREMGVSWKLAEKAGEMSFAQRKGGIARFFSTGVPLNAVSKVKQVTLFPGSPVVAIENQQIEMTRQGRKVYPRLYLYYKGGSWVILK